MYRFDKSRVDLAAEFEANPFGEHSPDLQYLLHLMRQPGPDAFHVLVVNQTDERWTLALLEPGGRAPRLTNTVFTDLREAEWHVFKVRWAKLAGEDLRIE